MGLSQLTRHETGPLSVDAIYRSLDRKVASWLLRATDVLAVYAYEDGALESFRAAQQQGIRVIYELPIGYWRAYRKILGEEALLQPEWATTLPGNSDSQKKLERKDEELALADQIVVASEFVRGTLETAKQVKAPISVIPYGAPQPQVSYANWPPVTRAKLRVIFVGSLSQRKGISYLLRAVELLGAEVELTLVGRRVGECWALDQALREHRWIDSLCHSDLLEEIRRHDVMVFPSLFEGFGLVLLEAMSCGVPVIATPHGAAPDFLTDGVDGFIVPIRDAEAIAERLETLSRDRARLAAMSEAALATAARQTWETYRRRLVTTVMRALAEEAPARLNTYSSQQPVCNPC
jgi:glycosyltransferase involved in cell wall biosynthesis